MAEPTVTRTNLRRSVARALQGEFFRRYSESVLSVTTGSTATSFTCSSLTQTENNFWLGGYVYFLTATNAGNVGRDRRISAFTALTDTVTFAEPFPANIAAGDTFEIHSLVSAAEIHEVLNRAIRDVAKNYPRQVIDETLVVQEKKRNHTLTGLAARVWRPKQVFVEQNTTAIHGKVASATYTGPSGGYYTATITFSDLTVTDDLYNGYLCSIVTGGGLGGINAATIIDTIAPNQIQVLSTVNTLSTTTLIMLWDPNVQETNWPKLTAIRFDFAEYPNTMFMQEQLDQYRGFRLRLVYIAPAAELTADTDTTTVPQEFLVNRSLQYLHEMLSNDNRSDATRHLNLAQYYKAQSEEFLLKNAPIRPAGTVWLEGDGTSTYADPDPLSWRTE